MNRKAFEPMCIGFYDDLLVDEKAAIFQFFEAPGPLTTLFLPRRPAGSGERPTRRRSETGRRGSVTRRSTLVTAATSSARPCLVREVRVVRTSYTRIHLAERTFIMKVRYILCRVLAMVGVYPLIRVKSLPRSWRAVSTSGEWTTRELLLGTYPGANDWLGSLGRCSDGSLCWKASSDDTYIWHPAYAAVEFTRPLCEVLDDIQRNIDN